MSITEAEISPMLHALSQDAGKLSDARLSMAANVVQARDELGHTWREIATATGMTEHGVAKLYARTKASRPRI